MPPKRRIGSCHNKNVADARVRKKLTHRGNVRGHPARRAAFNGTQRVGIGSNVWFGCRRDQKLIDAATVKVDDLELPAILDEALAQLRNAF